MNQVNQPGVEGGGNSGPTETGKSMGPRLANRFVLKVDLVATLAAMILLTLSILFHWHELYICSFALSLCFCLALLFNIYGQQKNSTGWLFLGTFVSTLVAPAAFYFLQRAVERPERIEDESVKQEQLSRLRNLDRTPDVLVRCVLRPDNDPASILCNVTNRGSAEATEVIIAFNNWLPKDTRIFAEPELGLRLEPVNSPPDPELFPELAKTQTAFNVRVPRIAASDGFQFTITTTDRDNRRAAKQIVFLRTHIIPILERFHSAVLGRYPEYSTVWQLDALTTAESKRMHLFRPYKFQYSRGRFPVEFESEVETQIETAHSEIYRKHKQEFLEVFKDQGQFSAPVIRIMTTDGERTHAIFPPYISTSAYVVAPAPRQDLAGKKFHSQPAVPIKYDYE